jgi:hypothetical protein
MNHGLRNIVAGYYGLVLRVTNRVNAGGYPGYPDQGPVRRPAVRTTPANICEDSFLFLLS